MVWSARVASLKNGYGLVTERQTCSERNYTHKCVSVVSVSQVFVVESAKGSVLQAL